MTLPPCRHRVKVSGRSVDCTSTWLVHRIPGKTTTDVCAICPYVDRKNRWWGAGDFVAWILSWLGIEKRTGCGCGARQNWLNRLWRFRLKPKRS